MWGMAVAPFSLISTAQSKVLHTVLRREAPDAQLAAVTLHTVTDSKYRKDRGSASRWAMGEVSQCSPEDPKPACGITDKY